jgi:DNA-binding PadR family transcriptional regulator
MKEHHRKRRDHRPDFWGDWQDEWHHHGKKEGDVPETGKAPPENMLNTWREFFHQYTGEWPEHHWVFGGRRFQPWHKGDVAFNPFVANLFSQGGGLLPIVVLHLLVEKPRYGNELMSLITQKTSGQWAANPGAIYPLMTELENRGLVEGQWEDPRKRTVRIYQLTERGKGELERVKAIVRPKLDEAIEVLQTIVNELNNQNNEQKEGKTNE